MHYETKNAGSIQYKVLEDCEKGLGLYSLPPKSSLDIYFDIESNPLLTKVPLHYLWGAAHEDNKDGFDCWWAHSEEEMKRAFESFMDWTKSDAFRMAHKGAGKHKDLYLGHPEFEGFKVVI